MSPEGLVRSRSVVVRHVLTQDVTKVRLAEHQDVVKTLPTESSDGSLHHGVRLRSAEGRDDGDDAYAP